MSFQSLIDEVENNINKILEGLGIQNVKFLVEPAKPGFGDASSNVAFLLSKHLKKSPKDISEILKTKYSECHSTLVSRVESHQSGYLNFFANFPKLTQLIISESFLDTYGSINLGENSSIVVEHTSVNPNKALHIGHIRNIVLGDSISRILKKSKYQVNVLNYVDDSGLQVADIVLGFQHLDFPLDPPAGKKFDHYCGDDVYVKTTERYQSDPSLEEIRKKILKELESGDSKTAEFADTLTKRILENQLETCWNLGVYYDCLNFESQIIRSGMWNKIFERLKKMKLIEFEQDGKNAGCWLIRGENNEDDKIIVRSTGTATYIAKDIPYAAWKLGLIEDPFYYQKYPRNQPSDRHLWQTTLKPNQEKKQNFSGKKVITVIDSRQKRLQDIITSLMSKFKSEQNAYVHLGYESVTLSSDTPMSLGLSTDGKQVQMSGRKGLYVNADSVYELLKAKTMEETSKRHPEMNSWEIGIISHQISVGTLRYEMIKQDLDKIIVFDLVKSLSLEGDTAPYIQYTYARASRIIERSKRTPSIEVDFSILKEKPELDLIKTIGFFEIYVMDAAKNLSPKVIARYCHEIAVVFNSFYEKIKVLDIENIELENSRLTLVNSFKLTLERSLELLGINAPEKM